jgi:hypothetical protein
MKDFNYWDKLHKNEELEEFSNDNVGLLWLKTKSISRKELIAEFIKSNKITLKETALAKQFVELFGILSSDVANSHQILDHYIKSENEKQVAGLNTEQLVSELYNLQNFDWGGDYQNSLDKYLIKRYVKVQNPSYENLLSKFETEINVAVKGYVLNSWYNHWSSILIEHIFKSHTEVLPTVGQIKSVDFFINDVPFDLKVTYLPAEYIKQKRKQKYTEKAHKIALEYAKAISLKYTQNENVEKELKNILKAFPKGKSISVELKEIFKTIKETQANCVELTYLKAQAKTAKISFDKKAKTSNIFYEIVEKMKDRNDAFSLNVLNNLKEEKLEILKEVQSNPKILATWLYENQGEMRFGSENRLFLVLVDTDDFTNSWKLKRNIDLLKPTILTYLDNFKTKKTEDLKIEFEFKGKTKTFTALTDIIFVVK